MSLIDRLRDNDEDARRELFEHCQAKLRPFFAAKLPNLSDVDDCVSEVVARALEGIRAGQEPEVLEAWLHGIARNITFERYKAAKRRTDELPAEITADPGEAPLELAAPDLPELPSEMERLMGKRELWALLGAAAEGISPGLQPIMRAHIAQTVERGKLAVGAELAKRLELPASRVDRQLARARIAMRNAIVALVLARTGRDSCPALAALTPPGRKVVLNPSASSAVFKHSASCPVCGPLASQAGTYSRWALGPGLLGLVQEDEEERRRMLLALFGRGADTAASAPTAVAGGGLIDRARSLVMEKLSTPQMQSVVQFVNQNPDLVRRTAVAVVGGGAVVSAAIIAILLAGPDDIIAEPPPDDPHLSSTVRSTPVTASSSVTTTPPVSPSASTGTPKQVPVALVPTTTTTTAAVAATTTTANQQPRTTTASTTSTSTTTTTTSTPPPQNAEITIDATSLSYTSFSLSGERNTRDPKQSHRIATRPGRYTLSAPGGGSVPFEVTQTGTVEYDHSYDTVLSGRGTSALVVRGARVTVDSSGLSYANATVSGLGWPAPAPVRTMNLLPGGHFFVPMGGSQIAFQVTPAGTVTYTSALMGGSGTSALTVRGLPITVDSTGLDYYNVSVTGVGWPTPAKVRTFHLVPGNHEVVTSGATEVPFTVTEAGIATYSSPLLSGTSTLAVHGIPVTLDSTDLDYSTVTIGGAGWPAPAKIRTFRLLPGNHDVLTPANTKVPFTLTAAGTLTHTSPVLTSSASTLAVHGLPITVDSTELDYASVSVTGAGWPAPAKIRTFRLLPGKHAVLTGAGNKVDFEVTDAGTVQFTSELLRGNGTATLKVQGLPITLDVSDIDYTNATVSGAGWPAPAKIRTFRLLPGPHDVHTSAGIKVGFTVTPAGTVTYDVQDLLAGANTSTLVVRGLTVTVDATATGLSSFTVLGLAGRNARQPHDLGLLPGAHAVMLPDGRRLPFTVDTAGHVGYDPGLDAVLAGRGTSSLVVLR
ncbi:hypothetical protein ACFOWZ_26575 [Lentzea rhizosphaerae]|uniref:RNA polymerase sigma factor, sigma-70 family n=1 Tax=Lentzea rhizosphaerae TaxID=2041025 RepID=A0ABV8BZC7_9PSEU